MSQDSDEKRRKPWIWILLLVLMGAGSAAWFMNGAKFEQSAPLDANQKVVDAQAVTGANDAPTTDNSKDQEAPTFDVVRIEPDGLSVIAGRAPSAGTVSLELDGTILSDAQVQAGPDGSFVVLTELPPSKTVQVLGLVYTPIDAVPGLADQDAAVVSIQKVFIDPAPVDVLESPAIADGAPQSASGDNAGPAQSDGVNKPRLLMADDAGLKVLPSAREPAQVTVVALDTISYTNEGDVSLGGRGAGDGFVRVYLDNKPITTSRIDDSGYWRAGLPQVDGGVYTLRVDELTADGAVASRVETPFKREEPADLQALVTGASDVQDPADLKIITVQPGTTLWALAELKYGNGMDFVKVFDANRDRIKDPDLIYPGQVFDMPN